MKTPVLLYAIALSLSSQSVRADHCGDTHYWCGWGLIKNAMVFSKTIWEHALTWAPGDYYLYFQGVLHANGQPEGDIYIKQSRFKFLGDAAFNIDFDTYCSNG